MTHRNNLDMLRFWKTALGRLRERRLLFEPLEDRCVLSGMDLLSHPSLDSTPASGHEDAFEAPASVPGQLVYYDYIEQGQLRGGTFFLPSDEAHGSTAYDPSNNPAWQSTTIRDNGPSSNRIDVVFVGDGYTASELATYAGHVDNIVPSFFAELPLDAYSSFFNVHRVDVISNESGVDHDPVQGILRDTALDMGFWTSGMERLLGVNVSKALAAASVAPGVDQVMAVANSTKYGGAGYTSSNLATMSGGNTWAAELALHEFGHSFAKLADEYTYGGNPTYTGPEPARPNVSIHQAADMAALETKWHLWLDHPNVDTYEGAMYSQYGIYRPTDNSKMRNLGRPFDQVNVEQFVFAIYQAVRPIDDATPEGSHPKGTQFFIDLVHPTTHLLDVQWYLDDVPIAGAVSPVLDTSAVGLSSSSHVLSVTVRDNTSLVRDENRRQSLMTEQRSWTLTAVPVVVSLEPPHGAADVRPDTELLVTWNVPIQKGSGSIVVRTLTDDSVVEVIDVSSPAVTVFQDTATIRPGSLLALNTAYYVEIGAGVFTDLAGNGWGGFSGREAWNFAVTIGSPPELVHKIADVTAAEDDPDTVIGLGPLFDDPDAPWGDQLTYTATVTMPIDNLVAQVSQSQYAAMHQNLLYTRMGDNRGFGPEHDLAQDNIYTYFVGMGLETALEPVLYHSQTYHNVVGVHAGVTRPDDIYLVGAHYDSVNNPGADDNASGVAAVMELARVMTQYQFDATLVFVAFDREEQGLHGAYAYTAAHDTSKIRGMLSLDMIAYNPPGTHHNKVRFYDSNGVGRIKSDLATAFASYSDGLTTEDAGKVNVSDHYPFELAEVDAALVIEYNVWSNPHYHKATDAVETPNYIDYAYATKVTRGVMGYLATVAGLASPSDLLTVTVDGDDLVLDYAADAHGVADIRVRATDSQGLYAEDTFRVTVSPVNDAPVLNPLDPMYLAPIAQDDSANPGTLVRDILAAGGPGTITDADWGALPGIAVTDVDNAHGTWQYTINNGRVWHAFGMPTTAEARLLGSDAGTRIRFLPAAGWYGSIDPAITFRAWDHTEGFSGQTADASVYGGATAFSTALETALITVDQIITTRIDVTIVHEPSATDGNGEVVSLPASADGVHEWQSFWIEIWASTPETTTLGIARATVDLQYYADYLTAMEIVHGPAFNVDPSGTIDDSQGLVSGIGGRTELTDAGDDVYVLLARVRFASSVDDQVPVDAAGRNIGPYYVQLALADGQTELVDVGAVVPELSELSATDLWAVMYDVDDNNQIDFGDFSYFAAAFGKTAGETSSEPPYVWWADFDKSGRVDFGDLAFFAPNFGKSRSNVQARIQSLVFPSNFPGAWRAGLTGGAGEWRALGGEGEAANGETMWRPVTADHPVELGSPRRWSSPLQDEFTSDEAFSTTPLQRELSESARTLSIVDNQHQFAVQRIHHSGHPPRTHRYWTCGPAASSFARGACCYLVLPNFFGRGRTSRTHVSLVRPLGTAGRHSLAAGQPDPPRVDKGCVGPARHPVCMWPTGWFPGSLRQTALAEHTRAPVAPRGYHRVGAGRVPGRPAESTRGAAGASDSARSLPKGWPLRKRPPSEWKTARGGSPGRRTTRRNTPAR
jgi:hypothetical protein